MAIGKLPEAEFDGGEGAIFAEINITPLTDVFLVMLIIFMVTAATVLHQTKQEFQQKEEAEQRSGLKVNLPSGETQEIDPVASSLVVAIPPSGEIYVNNQPVDEKQLDNIFRSHFARDKNTQVVLKADAGVNHGRVVGVMERAKRIGLTKLAIATSSE